MREIGRGSSGWVELCVLLEPLAGEAGEPTVPAGTQIAVKTIWPALAREPSALAALRAEAEAGRAVHHPSLARVHGCALGEHGPQLLMQYVPGRSLREALAQEGPLPEPLVRSIGAQIAGALAALHGAQLVHGDLKPENVRMDADGRAVLVDLGFARRLNAVEQTGQAGSLPYLSPERAQGAPASPESDVFALGIALYELVSGVHPFDESAHKRLGHARERGVDFSETSTAELMRRSLEQPGADELLAALATARYRPPSTLLPQISPFLDHVLEGALGRDPRVRPSAADLYLRFDQGERGAWWREQTPGEQRAAPGADAHLTPLVGRERELAALSASLHEVFAGRGGVLWLVGPAGSGKSRLVSALAEQSRARADAPQYLYARCTPLEEARPSGALLALLNRWLNVPAGTAPGARERERLERSVPPRDAEILFAALDPAAPGGEADSLRYALAGWLVAESKLAPLIVFVDDLQQAGEGTLGALARLWPRLAGARILLVLGLRADEGEARASAPAAGLSALLQRADAPPPAPFVRRLELGALDESALSELVTRLFHHSAPRLRLTRTLLERSQGNPGLLAEILRGMLARGQARPASPEDPRLVLEVSPSKLPVPRSLHQAIARRYRALAANDRLWLGRLAVVGGRFEPSLVLRAFPHAERVEVDALLTRLVHAGWLVAAGSSYRFARPALREAVLRFLAPERRRRTHAALARALAPEEGTASSLSDAFQRAWHLREAREPAQLVALLAPLIDLLLRHQQTQRLQTLADWGLAAIDELGRGAEHAPLRLALLQIAADAANRQGLRARERDLLDQLAELELDPLQQPRESARVYLLHARYAAGTGQYGLARGMLRNALELARRSGDAILECEVLRRLALVQSQVGELGEARKLADEALERAVGPIDRVFALLAQATVDLLEERLERALQRVERALLELRGVSEHAHPTPACVASLLRVRIWRSAGRPARARAACSHALELARRAGERRLEGEAAARLGGLLLDLDRPDEAEASLREAQLLADEMEDRRGQALASLWLSILLWERDDPQSSASIERSVRLAREIAYHRAEALGLAIAARIERAEGRGEAARQFSERALQLLEQHGAEVPDRIVIRATHALVLESAGDARGARRQLDKMRKEIDERVNAIESAALRAGLQGYSRRLLAAAHSADGPVYPRTSAHEPRPTRAGTGLEASDASDGFALEPGLRAAELDPDSSEPQA